MRYTIFEVFREYPGEFLYFFMQSFLARFYRVFAAEIRGLIMKLEVLILAIFCTFGAVHFGTRL